jgi:L-ectoine synthase
MIIRKLSEVNEGPQDVRGETWRSRRLLLAKDGMGFSLHDTIIEAGTTTRMHYKNHLEAVYCIEGEGTIEDLDTGETHAIAVGTVYALDRHDLHILRATSRMRMVCVFNPPVHGDEVHGPDGAYPARERAPAARAGAAE